MACKRFYVTSIYVVDLLLTLSFYWSIIKSEQPVKGFFFTLDYFVQRSCVSSNRLPSRKTICLRWWTFSSGTSRRPAENFTDFGDIWSFFAIPVSRTSFLVHNLPFGNDPLCKWSSIVSLQFYIFNLATALKPDFFHVYICPKFSDLKFPPIRGSIPSYNFVVEWPKITQPQSSWVWWNHICEFCVKLSSVKLRYFTQIHVLHKRCHLIGEAQYAADMEKVENLPRSRFAKLAYFQKNI